MAFRVFELNQHRIRLLIAGALLISILIFLSSSQDGHSRRILNKLSSSSTQSSSKDSSSQHTHYYIPTDLDEYGFLPLMTAEQFCKNRRFPVYQPRLQRRKIYDLILVNKEIDWLDIRLGQMYDHVDYFIITESATTFTDAPKPLSIQSNWDHFSKYHSKMIRHTLEESDIQLNTTWEREVFSRNAMYNQVLPYLKNEQAPAMGDVIIVADVDEIPRPDALTALRNCEFPVALTLRSRMYYYSFQWLNRINGEWPHPQATYYRGTDTIEPEKLRTGSGWNDNLFNAAWHCSYCFSSLDEMVNKVTSFSHSEYNREEFRDRKKILQRVRTGSDFFDRDDSHFDRIEQNRDIPDFLLRDGNDKKFAFVLDRDPESGNFKDY